MSPLINPNFFVKMFVSTLTLFLLGGGSKFDPPLFFLHNSKSIGLRLLTLSDVPKYP